MADLLFLAQRLPWPPNKGEKIRYWHTLNYLAQRYDVHFGCLIDDPADLPHVETVRAMCASLYAAPLDRRWAKLTGLRGLLTGEPLSVAYFRSRALRAWVADVMAHVKPAVTLVSSSNVAPYILDLPRHGRLVVDLCDVDSEKFRCYGDTSSAPMRQIYHREWRLVHRLERRVAAACDHAVFVSSAEAALFRALVPEAADKVVGISNGVDHGYFDPARQGAAPFDPKLPTFVFTGTMDYLPNIDAAVWFATAVLPRIRELLPNAQCFIVGSNPSERVKHLTQLNGVVVTGHVPDVRPYLGHATAAIAPMRIARGIQNKVLEAMAMGKPVIATSCALEGIAATPGQQVMLANDAETFANAAAGLATVDDGGPPPGLAIGQAARRLILERYDWEVCLRGYDELLQPGAGRPQGHS